MPNRPAEPYDPLIYIQAKALAALPSGVLYYPCSGGDYDTPLALFADYVDEFWFCDTAYLHRTILDNTRGNLIPRPFSMKYPAEFLAERSRICSGYRQTRPTEFNPLNRRRWIDPLIQIDIFQHAKTLKLSYINFRRGFAYDCLSKMDFDRISIFFYRGDSCGEGGSGLFWLNKKNVYTGMLLSRMAAGALIVTDNSNAGRQWRNRAVLDCNLSLADQLGKEFTFLKRRLKLVGNAGRRNGNTLVWQLQD